MRSMINAVKNGFHFGNPFVCFAVIKFCIGVYGKGDAGSCQLPRHIARKRHLFFDGVIVSIVVVSRHPCADPRRDSGFLLLGESQCNLFINQGALMVAAGCPELAVVCFAGTGSVSPAHETRVGASEYPPGIKKMPGEARTAKCRQSKSPARETRAGASEDPPDIKETPGAAVKSRPRRAERGCGKTARVLRRLKRKKSLLFFFFRLFKNNK